MSTKAGELQFPLVIVVIFIISLVHGDYIEYVRVSEDQSFLSWSFLIKWLLMSCVLIVYWRYALNVVRGGKERNILEKERKEKKGAGSKNEKSEESLDADPFENIRNKKELRSKAEVVLDKKRRN